MNRIIKFKAWDKDRKEWIGIFDNDYAIHFIEQSGDIWELVTCDGFGLSPNVEMSQFTGLTDKNGKEIYEGDIVRMDGTQGEEIGEVSFEPTEGYFLIKSRDEEYFTRCEGFGGGSLRGGQFTEVIGNIYENPELIR